MCVLFDRLLKYLNARFDLIDTQTETEFKKNYKREQNSASKMLLYLDIVTW